MKIVNYMMVFIAVTAIGMLYDRYSRKYYPDEELDKYNLVKKFLLNEDETITGKPFIWIHSKHKVNARHWQSFNSRNSRRLNQPYKDLCVESIVKNCGDNFKICLIDDSSFEKIIPNWSIQMDGLSDPVKSKVRVLALSKILHTYGGMLLPNSFICARDMKGLYDKKIVERSMFIGEFQNNGDSNTLTRFFPNNRLMGCKKGCQSMKELIGYMEVLISKDNTDESTFKKNINRFIYKLMQENKCGVICGKALGTKDKENNVILIDDLLESTPIKFCMCSLYGIYIPDDEVLKRTKYQWFARMSHSQVLKGNIEASRYLLISLGK